MWAAAILRAQMYKLQPVEDKRVVAQMATAIDVPSFVPVEGVKIAITDAEAEQMSTGGAEDDKKLERLHLAIAKLSPAKLAPLEPIVFEKDDDSNKHLDFITNCSNLRADVYDIECADRLKVSSDHLLFRDSTIDVNHFFLHFRPNKLPVKSFRPWPQLLLQLRVCNLLNCLRYDERSSAIKP